MLIKQSLKKNYRSNEVEISDADFGAISSLMAGVVETFEKKFEGGTDIPTPANLRTMKFGVSNSAHSLSSTVTIKHVKAGKHANDVFSQLGLFDADYKTGTSATKIRQLHQGARS